MDLMNWANQMNWWLTALAFVLGLLLTFAMMIRRVTREVPFSTAGSAAAAGVSAKLFVAAEKVESKADKVGAAADKVIDAVSGKLDAAQDKLNRLSASARRTGAALDAAAEEVPSGPYGEGSAAAGDGGSGPPGWLIKGTRGIGADSMLYHTPESPWYRQTIAEAWFADEATARAAGFDKWDKNQN